MNHDHHGHKHQGHHHHVPTNFGRAFIIGISLNVAFVLAEVVAGFAFESVSLLADAGHNLSDVLGLLLAFAAFRVADAKPSPRFTFGFGSWTILASSINGVLLLFAVSAICWEAIGRFWSPADVHGPGIILIALIGVVVNGVTAALFFGGRAHDLNIKGAYLHMLADTLVSVGVALGGVAILLTGLNWIDPIVSLVIALVIFYSTWGLLRDSIKLLSHGVPESIDIEELSSAIEALPEIESIHDLHVWALSTTKTALTVHVVSGTDNPQAMLTMLNHLFNREFGVRHATVQIETPDQQFDCQLVSDCSG